MAVFFTSLLPQFAAGSFLALLGLGLGFCALTLVWLAAYAIVVARAGDLPAPAEDPPGARRCDGHRARGARRPARHDAVTRRALMTASGRPQPVMPQPRDAHAAATRRWRR